MLHAMSRILIIFFCLSTFGCKVYQETDFRANKKEKYQKECGFLLFCAFYEQENRIAINFCTENTCDYYNTFQPKNCNNSIELVSLKPKFTQTGEQLELDRIEQETLHYYQLTNLEEEIGRNKSITLEIEYRNLQTGDTTAATYELIKNKYRYIVRNGLHG